MPRVVPRIAADDVAARLRAEAPGELPLNEGKAAARGRSPLLAAVRLGGALGDLQRVLGGLEAHRRVVDLLEPVDAALGGGG